MDSELRDFQKVHKRLCDKLQIELDEEHPFTSVMSELQGALDAKREEDRSKEMERVRKEKAEWARKTSTVHNADRENRTGQRFLQKREGELRKRFLSIINSDRKNAEVRYRYGFFLMEKSEFSRAISFFEEALAKNEQRGCTFQLEEAQKLKAHMFIGYCAGQLIKQSLEKVEELNVEEAAFDYDLKIEGRSLDEVMMMLKNEAEHYVAFYNGEKRIISLNEYLRIKAGEYGHTVLISFVEPDVFVKVGKQEMQHVPVDLAALLRFKIETVLDKGNVTYEDIQYKYGSRNSWETHRRYISRINRLTQSDDVNIFELEKGTFEVRHPQSFRLAANDYVFVFRQSYFFEEGIE